MIKCFLWMKMLSDRREGSTDWWSCRAGQSRGGSMADASFCNGQYIPGSTPYPTPPEDTFSIFIFSLVITLFYIFNLHSCLWLFSLELDHAFDCIWDDSDVSLYKLILQAYVRMQRVSGCNKDKDATRINLQRGWRCKKDKDATRIKKQNG